jgi:hypothetical protein
MDPIQALEMLGQVVKGIKLPYNEHVLLERSLEVLRTAIQDNNSSSDTEEEPVIFEETAPKQVKASKKQRRGGRREK